MEASSSSWGGEGLGLWERDEEVVEHSMLTTKGVGDCRLIPAVIGNG